MSDLIEKLKEDLEWVTGYNYPDQKEVSSLLTKSDLIEAISALETVRGIEEIVKTGWGLELVQQTYGSWLIWYGALRNDFADGPTLSAAVEAARKGM